MTSSTLAASANPSSRISPRVERSKAAILAAAADLLIEGGASKVTIDRVTERSGVAKTTIYRHWPSRSHVLFDAFASLLEGPAPIPPAGPLREQLCGFIRSLVRGLTQSQWGPVIASIVDAAERDAELRELMQGFLFAKLEHARAVLVAAQASGELRADIDIDVAMSMLAGAAFYRRLISCEEMAPSFAEQLIDQFLRGAT